MHSSLTRLGALALCGAALAACAATPTNASSLTGRERAAAEDGTQPANLDDAVRQARLLRASGDFAGAVHQLSQLMLAAPDDPRVVGEYGKVLTQQGRVAEAVDFLKRAIELQPSDWTLYSALGVCYDQQNDAKSAQAAYEQALALKPNEAVILNNYAMSRMLAGDLAQAQIMLAKAAASSADPKIAHNLVLVNGLVPTPVASLPPPPVDRLAAQQPVKQTEAATHAPKTLIAATPVASQAASTGVVMQAVPFDPKAGPVSSKKTTLAKASHAPKKLAETPKLRQTPAHDNTAHENKVPALRLAADGA